MEVHAPSHPLHTWRDFFIHIATIVIGLLIAIGLEQSVEWLHHRHIVHEARENIRHELEVNRDNTQKNLDAVAANAANMKSNVAKARTMRDSPRSVLHGEMHFTFSWDSFSESAWLSARDSGALTYMPSDEVQRYADVYSEQEIINKQAVDIFTHQSEIMAPLLIEPDDAVIPRDEIQPVITGSAVTYTRLETLHELLGELQRLYAEELKR